MKGEGREPETIAAIATAAGPAAIGVLRISGPAARRIRGRIFRPLAPGGRHRQLCLGEVVADGEPGEAGPGRVLDRVLAAFFPGPHTYTGEDLLEIQAHGGPRNLAQILDAVLAAGARLARPGEFTLRAFLNGKLELTEAEAVVDLIEAESDAAADLAREQLRGGLRSVVGEFRERVLSVLVALEAELDFPDDGTEAQQRRCVQRTTIGELAEQAHELASSAQWGERLLAGFRVVLVGPPNAGKSSLFNRLVGAERALVHEDPGTTRDLLEGRTTCQELPVVLVDGAGWNEQARGLERAGMELMQRRLDEVSLAVLVVDGSLPGPPGLPDLVAALGALDWILALNKGDLECAWTGEQAAELAAGRLWIGVSASTGEGIEELWSAVGARLAAGSPDGGVLTRARHREALEETGRALERASELLAEGEGALELVAEELRAAVRALDRVSGTEYDSELLDRVFSRFCLGK